VKDEANRLQRAAATKDPALMQQTLDGATTAGLYQYETISNDEVIDNELDNRFIHTDIEAKIITDKDTREDGWDALLSSRLKGKFTAAHDVPAPAQEPEPNPEQSAIPGFKPNS